MNATIIKLQTTIADYSAMLENVIDDEFSKKPRPERWSKKEILGHVIDSAQNNLRRFIVAQYETTPFIRYDQDKWVTISNYQNAGSVKDMIELWRLLNLQILQVLRNTTPEAAMRTCESGPGNVNTISFLAEDYVKHLIHHLHQVLDLESFEYR